MSATFEKWFPWTQSPVVCNGPMLGVASPKLATEVTKAGGIGAFSPSSLHYFILSHLRKDLYFHFG